MATIATLAGNVGQYLAESVGLDGTGDLDVITGKTTITVYAIEVDNSLAAETVYFKMYEAATPTIGTTAPDIIIPVLAGATAKVHWPGGLAEVFTAQFSLACVQEAGTAGTTDPSASVTARVLYSFTV